MFAWFSIPGVIDSVPMNETDPRQQPYWGEAVFGAGAVPDTMLIEGIYSGVYTVPESVSVAKAPVIYHLATPPKRYIHPLTITPPVTPEDQRLLKLVAMPDSLQKESGYRVSLNSREFPFTVRFLDSVQTLRYGPRLGYFSIFQPAGVEALVVGSEGDWYRARLSAPVRLDRSESRHASGAGPISTPVASHHLPDVRSGRLPVGGNSIERQASVSSIRGRSPHASPAALG